MKSWSNLASQQHFEIRLIRSADLQHSQVKIDLQSKISLDSRTSILTYISSPRLYFVISMIQAIKLSKHLLKNTEFEAVLQIQLLAIYLWESLTWDIGKIRKISARLKNTKYIHLFKYKLTTNNLLITLPHNYEHCTCIEDVLNVK